MIFKCNNCGGNIVYNPEKRAMHCEHCDGIDTESEVPGGVMSSCVNCGAPVYVDEFNSASKCEHCGTYCIFEERIRGEYKPHLVVPFQLSKEMAKKVLMEKFEKNLFLPGDFLSKKMLQKIEGIYVPYWMYDYDANYNYRGIGKKIRKWVSGNTEYTEVSTYTIYRNMDIDFDKIPVDASNRMNDRTMDLLEPYDYNALEEFKEKYMSGFLGEMYNQPADVLEPRAKEKAQKYADRLLANTITGYDTVTPTERDLRLDKKATNYSLLPLWYYSYRFKDKVYDYYINGQTGKVSGKAPIAVSKVVIFILLCLLTFGALAVFGWGLLEVL